VGERVRESYRCMGEIEIEPGDHWNQPKDMYQSKKMMCALDLKYEKIDICPDNWMLFWKVHGNEKKFLECG
jgi:hypothetical protein